METFFQAAAKMVSSPPLSQQPMQLTFKWPNLLDCNLKRKKKPTKKQTSCISKKLYCFPLAQAGSDTIKCESWEKESKQEQALFGTSPLILLTSPVYFIQSEEGIGECYEEVRKEYDCFVQKISFWYQPAFYIL